MSVSGPLLVTGASGLLGRYLVRAVETRGLDAIFAGGTTGEDDAHWTRVDLTDDRAVGELWERVHPALIIHAAALTNVDLCERDPALADSVNRRSVEFLAHRAKADGARLVHISTDSVFDGHDGGYTEEDEPAPVNAYARTKVAAEQEAAAVDDHLVVRTNFFGRSRRGHGLAEWLLGELGAERRIVGFSDVVFSPLYCGDFAELVLELATSGERGVIHLAGSDSVSKLEFATLVAEAYGHDASLVQPGRLEDVNLAAPRPLNTSLVVERAETALGRSLPSVESGIAAMRSADGA
jgi:dTDP-4-dehydrorhamnose reductase